jgi:DNA-directed RNA polymerase specialized sigma subunit
MVPSLPENRADLAGLADEELVLRIRRDRSQLAQAVLVERHLPRAKRIVARRLRGRRSISYEVEDVEQCAAGAILEASAKYDPSYASRAPPYSFLDFLRRVLDRRITNFLRGQH